MALCPWGRPWKSWQLWATWWPHFLVGSRFFPEGRLSGTSLCLSHLVFAFVYCLNFFSAFPPGIFSHLKHRGHLSDSIFTLPTMNNSLCVTFGYALIVPPISLSCHCLLCQMAKLLHRLYYVFIGKLFIGGNHEPGRTSGIRILLWEKKLISAHPNLRIWWGMHPI